MELYSEIQEHKARHAGTSNRMLALRRSSHSSTEDSLKLPVTCSALRLIHSEKKGSAVHYGQYRASVAFEGCVPWLAARLSRI